jgi:zinc protease
MTPHSISWPTFSLVYVLTGAKNSRLTQQLVYEDQLASDIVAFQDSKRLDGDFTVRATARPGHALPELHQVIEQEIARLATDGPTQRELEQAQNSIESSFLNRLERVLAKADLLNGYYYFTGEPDYFARDLARYQAVTADDVRRTVSRYLLAPKVILSVVPDGKPELAVQATEVTP